MYTSLLEKRDKDQGDRYNAQMVLMYIHSNYFSYVLMHVENRVGMAYTVIDFNVKVKRISDNISIHWRNDHNFIGIVVGLVK